MLFTSRSALAQERLLAELRTQGSCVECAPPVMMYGIGFSMHDSPVVAASWLFMAGISDVGQERAVPTDLLPAFADILTFDGFLIGSMGCCSGDVGTINSGGLTNGTQQDKVMITRSVPPLGLNFVGFQITNLTMTIDRLEWIPISSNQFRAETAYVARIYGVPEAFAVAHALVGSILAALRIRLPRR
jgi:hypothetical protein